MSSTIPMRARLAKAAGQQFGGERDMNEVLGYPLSLDAEDYAALYQRGDIAARIVDAYPDATWGEAPEIIVPDAKAEDGNPEVIKGLDDLAKKFQIWRTLHRLDRLTNMGHYGVLVIGLDGDQRMVDPVPTGQFDLIYLQPHSERTAQILEWEDRPQSPRYGMPKLYGIQSGTNWTGRGTGKRWLKVHHSRVIHVAERSQEDVSIGTPRLERIWNRMMDLDKLLGGGAEMYWQNVSMLLAIIADKDTQWEQEDSEALTEQLNRIKYKLDNFMRLRGVEAKNLAPGLQGADPSNLIDKELDFIAGATGIPKRILIGSERGELASSQDETAWSNRIMERREQHAGPNIIEPLLDKLMSFGCLQKQPYEVSWPEEDTLGEVQRSQIAKTKAETMSAYNGMPGNELIASPAEVREWIGLEGPPPAQPVEPPIDEGDEEVTEQFGQLRRVQ